MAEFAVQPRFSFEWSQWEKTASPRDLEELDRAMASIVLDPALPGRLRSHYDPLNPSFLYRIESAMIHYRVVGGGDIEFLNLFPR
ncbi:MAG TPA: hypothetical protein VMU16_00900 [Candidatus Binataceae bacterium]|nr:hypothetical protein [Candidatus Binataceae bacterium]